MRRKLWLGWILCSGLLLLESLIYWASGYVREGYEEQLYRQFYQALQTGKDIDGIPYATPIKVFSKEAGVEARLAAAMIQAESSFQPRIVSPAGAVGLMQVMPDTWHQVNRKYQLCVGRHAGECSVDCYFNPELNIQVGTLYMGELLTRYQGDRVLALAAYNAGPAAVDRYKGIPPYEETVEYVERVILYTAAPLKSLIEKRNLWRSLQSHVWWCQIATLGLTGGLLGLRLRKRRSYWSTAASFSKRKR